MPLPLIELPIIATAFILEPAANPSTRPAPIPCGGQHPRTVADCYVHLADWDRHLDLVLITPLRDTPKDSERKASHVGLW
ncbi:hypothetical protein [Sphingobium sp. B12D2B]|uniref:hypothetical protein n=1 Tax=Sphingobium sp. B12D2B TaxID=2940577 RepID=UPI002224F2F0|nr:hypothetical protein [Sphingobium sp. B12D2B]MCW2351777.1 hypothetical protein [Sphingobium sp. B12D2B]